MKTKVLFLFLLLCGFVHQKINTIFSKEKAATITGLCMSTSALAISGVANGIAWLKMYSAKEISDVCIPMENDPNISLSLYRSCCGEVFTSHDNTVQSIRPNFDAAFKSYFIAFGIPIAYAWGLVLYKNRKTMWHKINSCW